MPLNVPTRAERPPRRERGVALIVAVLTVAIAVTTAAALNYEAYLGVRRTQNTLAAQQVRVYARAAEAMAMQLLQRDRENNDIDSREDIWARPIQPLTLDDGAVIKLELRDLQGRFNLNNLALHDQADHAFATEQLRRLLAAANPQYTTGVPVALADWLDANTEVRFPGGAEDDYYTREKPAYRPGNTLMRDSSELRLVRGMDTTTWRALRPAVTALPEPGTAINVNTARPAVLASLSPDTALRDGKQAAQERRDSPWGDVATFLSRNPNFAGPNMPTGWLTVTSRYFLAHTVVRLDRARRELFSIIHRPRQGGMQVVYRATSRP